MRIFETAATGANSYEQLDPNDFDTYEEYEQAVKEQQSKAKDSSKSSNSYSSGSTVGLSGNLKDSYSSSMKHKGKGYDSFQKYFNDLSSNIKNECLASFDTQADFAMQKTIAETLFSGGKTAVNINELQSKLAAKGITVSTEYKSATYRVDEYASGGDGYVTNGAITVMTFKDKNGGEIKIADANGNAALETDELFMNELLGGVTADIGNLPTGDSVEAATNEEEDNSDLFMEYMMEKAKKDLLSIGKTDKESDDDDNSYSEKEINEIKEELIDELYKEIKAKYPDLSEDEAREKAETYADEAIKGSYELDDKGLYTKILA